MKKLNYRKEENIEESKNLSKKLLFIDLPKKDISEDKFEHNIYVTTLEKIINKCDTPINIGLFGKWGVGKTSIINFLKTKIENEKKYKNKIKFLKPFDIWKYSGSYFKTRISH